MVWLLAPPVLFSVKSVPLYLWIAYEESSNEFPHQFFLLPFLRSFVMIGLWSIPFQISLPNIIKISFGSGLTSSSYLLKDLSGDLVVEVISTPSPILSIVLSYLIYYPPLPSLPLPLSFCRTFLSFSPSLSPYLPTFLPPSFSFLPC